MFGFGVRKEDLYWHFVANAWAYCVGAGFLALFGGLVWYSSLGDTAKESQLEQVKGWPVVEATVVGAEVLLEGNRATRGVNPRYQVTVDFEYQVEGDSVQTTVRKVWRYPFIFDPGEVFEVGESVPLRVNPNNLEEVSLIELTGEL